MAENTVTGMNTENEVRIGGTSIEQIIANAARIVESFVNYKLNPKPERKGGYLTIRDRISGMIMFVTLIGE